MNWDDDFFDPYVCRVCKTEDCIIPSGPQDSPILVIGEFPGGDEIKKGRPMVGAMGAVFRNELAYAGIDMKRLRICNLWHHKVPSKDSENYEKCFQEGLRRTLEEAKDKKMILLIGSDTVRFFCNESVTDVNGLLVRSEYLSAPTIMACIQPATVWHQSLGELRLSAEKFSRLAQGLL